MPQRVTSTLSERDLRFRCAMLPADDAVVLVGDDHVTQRELKAEAAECFGLDDDVDACLTGVIRNRHRTDQDAAFHHHEHRTRARVSVCCRPTLGHRRRRRHRTSRLAPMTCRPRLRSTLPGCRSLRVVRPPVTFSTSPGTVLCKARANVSVFKPVRSFVTGWKTTRGSACGSIATKFVPSNFRHTLLCAGLKEKMSSPTRASTLAHPVQSG